ncbi:MAG: flagellar hook-associated protein FlgK, partial [Thermodesulfovibrionales bacterium]|nr:flagellar hook-associated protein FlgK [Thermodesulfovibrionales bacterium]
QLSEVRRMYDSFTTLQLRTEKANASYWETYESNMLKLENIFNEAQDLSIGQGINDFFDQWQQVVKSPEGYAERSMLINKGEYLAERISNAFYDLQNQRSDLMKSTQSLVSEINKISEEISDLNEKIGMAPGAHDLKDKRDALVERLNEIVKVNTFEDNNGRYTVLIGGVPLVDGGKYYQLRADADPAGMMKIYSQMSNPETDITKEILGGELKANLDLRDTNILGIMNKLNIFSINLADSINFYHRQGYGLDGSTGKDFFYQNNSLVNWTNSTNGTILRYYANNETTFNQTINRTYTITFGGGNNWTVAWSDNTTVPASSGSFAVTGTSDTTTNPNRKTLSFDGKTIMLQHTAAFAAGETFTIGQNANAARNLSVAISDPNHLAVAAGDTVPLSNLNNQIRFSVDGGTSFSIAQIPTGEYTRNQLASALTTVLGGAGVAGVTYNSVARTFTITNNMAGNMLVIDWNSPNSTAAGLFGFNTNSFINAGGGTDVSDYNVYPATAGERPRPGDNLNARLMNGLKDTNIMIGAKPIDYYQRIVDYVGVEAESSKINNDFYENLINQLENKRQEISGVSLDEEAINLVKLQKSFQAAAKLISVADELFATLVNMTGR